MISHFLDFYMKKMQIGTKKIILGMKVALQDNMKASV